METTGHESTAYPAKSFIKKYATFSSATESLALLALSRNSLEIVHLPRVLLLFAAQRPEQEDARSMAKHENPPSAVAGLSLRAQQRSGSSASNASDEDTDGDHKSGSRTQSRIDKWKAKHEAMLKMAAKDKAQAAQAAQADPQDKASASSEDETTTSTTTEIKANGVCISLNKPSPASLQAPPALSVK